MWAKLRQAKEWTNQKVTSMGTDFFVYRHLR
jgi:hypothetical protein